jgi:hypothetical protein
LAAFRSATDAAAQGRRLLLLLVVALIASAGLELWSLMRFEPLGMDLLPLWAAGHMAWGEAHKVYDFAAVTAAQASALPPHFAWLRPYPYPPTTLLLLAPLGRLPFWAADAIWSIASLGVFLVACLRLAERNRVAAALLATCLPAVVIAASAGQPVVLAGGLLVIAVLELERRPRIAGALFALAAIAKPQAAIMAPVALVACGALEALVAAGLVGAAAVAASVLFFGAERWSEWLASLPAFERVVESVPRLGTAIVTPLWAARELGLKDVAAAAVAGVFALAGAGMVWRLFRRPSDAAHRVGALALGALVAAPYAMCYDATLLAPAAAAMAVAAIGRGRPSIALFALAAAYEVTQPNLGLPALLAFAAVVIVDWRSAPARAASATMAPSGALP